MEEEINEGLKKIFLNIFNRGYELGSDGAELSEDKRYQEILNIYLKQLESEEFNQQVLKYNLSEKEILEILTEFEKKMSSDVESSITRERCCFCAHYEWKSIHEGACSYSAYAESTCYGRNYLPRY